jgi:hypothetical protein
MRPLVLAASVMLLTPAVAYADGPPPPPIAPPPIAPPSGSAPPVFQPPPLVTPPRPDRFGVAFDLTAGFGAHLGEVGGHAQRPTGLARAGVGIARGRFAYLISATTSWLGQLEESGTTEPGTSVPPSFFEYGLEPSIRYELTRGTGRRFHLRAGWRWRWLKAVTDLPRTCDRNGGCDGGYYVDAPTYGVHGPSLAFGIGRRLRGDMWGAYGVEVAITRGVIRRPGANPDLGDTVVTVGLNLGIGRGAH